MKTYSSDEIKAQIYKREGLVVSIPESEFLCPMILKYTDLFKTKLPNSSSSGELEDRIKVFLSKNKELVKIKLDKCDGDIEPQLHGINIKLSFIRVSLTIMICLLVYISVKIS
jgi:hypothetical protein